MAHHQMNLRLRPFEMIACGKKIFELRLLDEKRKEIRVGDTLSFINTEDAQKILTCRVEDLYPFADFEALYRALPLDLCGYEVWEVAGATAADMEAYYSLEKQKKYGVIAIKIKLEE